MNDKELQEWTERNWSKVPEEKRKECIEHLREVIPEDQQKKIKEAFEKNKFDPWFHFGGGMAVRNTLRDIMKDDELPLVEYEGGHSYSNWDDYYMAALKEAVME